jgi:nickel superoxide dismutase
MGKKVQIILTVFVVLFSGSLAWSHCEIPCGIYDDEMRIHMAAEHIATIEKAMKEITRLQAEEPRNYNQLVRWIVNKEEHATMLQDIITQYFMTQRIKIDDEDYKAKLAVLHKIIVYAMKCKQGLELEHIETLRNLLESFSHMYFEHHHPE